MRVALKSWVVAGALLLALGGCAGSSAPPDSMTEAKAAILIETVLRDIEDIYYRETRASELVTAGLSRIQSTSREVRFTKVSDAFIATVGGQPVFQFKAGKDQGDADDWGGRVAAMLSHIEQAPVGEDGESLSALADAFLAGITDSLIYRTHYRSPERVRLSRLPTEGGNGWLNLMLRPEVGGWRVYRVVSLDLSRSNLIREGDFLVAVDRTSLDGLSDVEMFKLLRGPVGSPAELKVMREGNREPLTVTLYRESRETSMLGAYPEGSALRIVIPYLAPNTFDDLRDLLTKETTGPNAAFTSVILDLRENPGGYLESSIALADLFLAEGRILATRGRHLDSHQNFMASDKAPMNSLPFVVLVDEHTASGGEIVALALQDNGRAIVIGATTFGVGTIQTVLPLPNSGELTLPWTEVIAAGGYRLDKRGVMPTVCTGGEVTADAVLAALRNGGGVIDRATRTRDFDPEDTAAIEAFRALCPPRSDGADVSLEVARALLADPALYSQVLAAASQ